MRICLLVMFFIAGFAYAQPDYICEAPAYRIQISLKKQSAISITMNHETVLADGFVGEGEIDLVARFPAQGEMTLYARVGSARPQNYLFVAGERFPVVCR